MSKNIDKNISKKLSGKNSQKLLDHTKQFARKKKFKKTAGGTGDLIDNIISNRITKVSKTSQQSNSETVTHEVDKKNT